MENADTALVMLTAAIFFALIIERVLEIAKSIYDYIEARQDFSGFWDRRAISIRDRLQNRLDRFKQAGEQTIQKKVFKHLASRYVNEKHPGYEGAPVISANKLRAFTVKSVSKSVGVILGISVAACLGINVFELIAQWTDSPDALELGLLRVDLPNWVDYAISGIVMGLGSGPMHKFITALERARKNRQTTDAT
jgi:hypothetical protein